MVAPSAYLSILAAWLRMANINSWKNDSPIPSPAIITFVSCQLLQNPLKQAAVDAVLELLELAVGGSDDEIPGAIQPEYMPLCNELIPKVRGGGILG